MDVALPGAQLRSVSPLTGGNFTSIWRLEVDLAEGDRRPVVARIRPADAPAAGVGQVLPRLRELGIPAPRLIWTGDLADGRRATVLEFLHGESVGHDTPLATRVRELAMTLAAVHALDHRELGHLEPFPILPTLHHRSWISPHPLAETALAVLDHAAARLGTQPEFVVHGDYWTGNILWDKGRIVGLLDWDNVGRGSSAADVAKCRLDLALRFGTEAADDLLAHYELLVGTSSSDQSYWDLRIGIEGMPDPGRWWLPTYQRLGVTDLTPAIVRQRYDVYLHRVLQTLR